MNKISIEHLLDLIDSLPKNQGYDYIIPGKNKAVLLQVNKRSKTIDVEKMLEDGSRKSAGITLDSLSIIASAAIEGKPFSVDSIFNGSGSARSTWEALIANTTEFYWCKVNKKKHLVWLPEKPHDLGVISEIDSSDLPDVEIQYLEPSVCRYITQFDSELLNEDDLVRLLKKAVKLAPKDALTLAIHDFAIRYATHIDNCSQLAIKTWGNNSNSAVLSDGKKIGLYYRGFIDKSVDKSERLQVLNLPLQQIYYGAPGTGKSHATNEVISNYPDTVRTTFHPDSDYSTFVGAYKPTMTKVRKAVVIGQDEKEVKPLDCNSEWEEKITYKFVKQAFLKAYVKAWKLFKETCVEGEELAPQFLVIEEINRGNCAQIFGDLFQLLDRKQNFSEYPIEADADICKALLEEDTEDNPSFGSEGLQLTEGQKTYINNVYDGKPVAEKICNGQVLVLPPNLYIWATMNTSDQSLFPIDSAFKRRWEWKYMKIKEGKDKDGNKLDWKIVVKDKDDAIVKFKDEESLSWWSFIQKINTIIASMTSSADKQLGYFFCKADKDGEISGETFVSKVIFYLWNDVFKDYGFEDASLFRYKVKEGEKDVEKDLTFPDFYDEDGEKVNAERLVDFIQKVMDWQKPEDNV